METNFNVLDERDKSCFLHVLMSQANMICPIMLLQQCSNTSSLVRSVPRHCSDIFVKDICETFAVGVYGHSRIMERFFHMIHVMTQNFYYIPSMAIKAYMSGSHLVGKSCCS